MRPLVSIVVCRSIRPSLSSVVALQIDEMMVDWSRNAGFTNIAIARANRT
jgi:hypothetical protein